MSSNKITENTVPQGVYVYAAPIDNGPTDVPWQDFTKIVTGPRIDIYKDFAVERNSFDISVEQMFQKVRAAADKVLTAKQKEKLFAALLVEIFGSEKKIVP